MKAITYLRVSTKAQGASQLGLEAQRDIIHKYIRQNSGELVEEYIDVVSGAKDDRIQLQRAMKHAKSIGGVLVIAKLDRISRRVSFISALMESGIVFKVAEMPEATTFQLHLYAALAAEERRLIRERTKAALQAAKARGVKLGTHGRIQAERNRQLSSQFVSSLSDRLLSLREAGLSFSAISNALNEEGIQSYRGGAWYPMTVTRAFQRLEGAI